MATIRHPTMAVGVGVEARLMTGAVVAGAVTSAGVATKAANITVMAVETTETTAAATTAATRTEIEASLWCRSNRA
jgi:hypothetical protein